MHIRTNAGLVEIALSNEECCIIISGLNNISTIINVETDYSMKVLDMSKAIQSANQLIQKQRG